MIVLNHIFRFIIGLIAMLAASMFILPVLFSCSVSWLKSNAGQDFLRTTLEQQIKSQGYEVSILSFKYEYPLSFYVSDIEILVKDKPPINVNDINLNINLHSFFTGALVIDGFYNKMKYSLKTEASWQARGYSLKHIKISSSDFYAVGDVFINKVSNIMIGNISGKIDSLLPYKDLIGVQHNIENIDFNVVLDKKLGQQKISINLQIPSYINENIGVTLSGVDIKTHILKQASGYKISGEFSHNKIDIKLPERFVQSAPQVNIVTSNTSTKKLDNNIELDMVVYAPDKIFVRGWGLDAEFGGKLAITGFSNDPQINGSFNVLRGRYNEFGKNFKISKANLTFLGSMPSGVNIDILSEIKVKDKIVQISIIGPVLEPKIKFSSKPSMPEDEVLSYILFGNGVEDISPFQAVRLAQTLQRFSGNTGGSSFNPIGSLRSATGLDDLHFDIGDNGGANVGAGKYISDKIYLEFEAGSEEGSSNANIEIELSPNITLESEVGQGSHSGAGIFWKHDY